MISCTLGWRLCSALALAIDRILHRGLSMSFPTLTFTCLHGHPPNSSQAHFVPRTMLLRIGIYSFLKSDSSPMLHR